MKISGEASVGAGMPQVYAALTDPAVLVRVIPGCQRLEQTGPDTYKATMLAGVAAIKGTFDGEVRLSDRDEPHAFTLHASGAGAPGTVSAVARVSLAEAADGTTQVAYDADATIGGVIGGVGQRMITGVARKTAAEFFAAVDRELTGKVAAAAVLDAGLEEANLPAPPAVSTIWTAPGPDAASQLARQRVRDLMVGAAFGAVVALLGVLIGAIVAGWG
jgi:carbon monoxide dehydrogenase subunit G